MFQLMPTFEPYYIKTCNVVYCDNFNETRSLVTKCMHLDTKYPCCKYMLGMYYIAKLSRVLIRQVVLFPSVDNPSIDLLFGQGSRISRSALSWVHSNCTLVDEGTLHLAGV